MLKIFDLFYGVENGGAVQVDDWETRTLALEAVQENSKEVKNVKGTSHFKCVCGSWIKHWENHATIKKGKCSNIGCTKDATDGAHIKKVGLNDHRRYIIPLCHSCNMSQEPFFTKSSVSYVIANVKKTCKP